MEEWRNGGKLGIKELRKGTNVNGYPDEFKWKN